MSENETVKKPSPATTIAKGAAASKTPGRKLDHPQAGTTYANYLFGGAGVGDKPAWSDSTKGRFFIRVITRGLFGTGAFVWGGRVARKQLQNYSPYNFFETTNEFGEALAFGKKLQNFGAAAWERKLAGVAWVLDHSIAKGFEKFAYYTANVSKAEPMAGETLALAKKRYRVNAAWEATNFRTKGYFYNEPGLTHIEHFTHAGKTYGIERGRNGRSYGAEVAGVTFDFFMASIGDALGRNIIQGIDPHIKHSWIVDKNGNAEQFGKGHFSPKEALKTAATTSWRILTKNAGEDWVAGLFYVYQMKFQRQLIANVFPNSKLSLDNHWNGTAMMVDKAGKIVGDFQAPGALDLHMRFVGYNWYTLMFREAYDKAADHLKQWRHGDAPLLPHHLPQNPVSDTLHAIGHSTRYVAKSFIKANLYMQPAVIPFWLFRVPQTKWKGAYVLDAQAANENAIGTVKSLKRIFPDTPINKLVRADGKGFDFLYPTAREKYPTAFGLRLAKDAQGNAIPMHDIRFGKTQIHHPSMETKDAFSWSHFENYVTKKPNGTTDWAKQSQKWFSQALYLPGKLSYKAGTGLTRISDKLVGKLGEGHSFSKFISWDPAVNGGQPCALAREHVMRNFADAAMAYTPYMWAKQETGLRVDEHAPNKKGPMDYAIYRLIDSTIALHPRQMITAGRDVFRLGINFDKDVISREGHMAKPKNTVMANSIVAQHVSGPSAPLAPNDNHNGHNDNEHHERNWAETVAGRQLGAQYQAPVATRQ